MRFSVSVLALLLGLIVSVAAAPRAELWPRWQERDEGSSRSIDHAAWDLLLKRYVRAGADGINRVAYREFSGADRSALTAYIDTLSTTAVSGHNAQEQFAFWVNLYNALTVQVVLEHYPVRSIKDINISPGLFSSGPWGKKLLTLEGEPVSLDDIEHRILRPIWKDPRIHYAVNCAALGCPNLPPQAFTARDLPAQLDRAARAFVNHPRGVSVDGGRLRVSSIYRWFKDDFGGSDRQLIEHLKRYATPPLRASLETVNRVDGDDYDWRVNSASGGA